MFALSKEDFWNRDPCLDFLIRKIYLRKWLGAPVDYSHFDKLAFSANLDIPDCDIKDNIKLAGELRQYDPGVGGQNAALRFFFEVREALERSTQSTPQDLGKKPSSWGSGPVGTRRQVKSSYYSPHKYKIAPPPQR